MFIINVSLKYKYFEYTYCKSNYKHIQNIYIYILFDFFDFWIAITLKKNISGKFDSDM